MSVMTHRAHMVVVFHLCVSVGTLNVSGLNDMKLVCLFFLPKARRFHNPILTNIFSVSFSLSPKLSQEEIERRRIRRERNKLAAAKCRNRRRELTDTLQHVSEPSHKCHSVHARNPSSRFRTEFNNISVFSLLPSSLPWCRRLTSWRTKSPVCRRKSLNYRRRETSWSWSWRPTVPSVK